MTDIPETWLEEFNKRMGDEGMPHIQRPFRALREWSLVKKCSIRLDSPEARKMFDWFYSRSPEGAHVIGSLYTGSFYYDSHFWAVEILLGLAHFN